MKKLLLALMAVVLLGSGLLVPAYTKEVTAAPGDCASFERGFTQSELRSALDAGLVRADISINAQTRTAKAVVANDTFCEFPVALSSYQMVDRKLSTQRFFAESGVVRARSLGQTVLETALPNCMAQIDLWYGSAPRQLSDFKDYTSTGESSMVFKWAFYLNNTANYYDASGQFCGTNQEPRLVVEKTGFSSVFRGNDIAYDLTIRNTGNLTATAVVLTDNIPSQTTFVSVSGNDFPCEFLSTPAPQGSVRCSVGDLLVGQSKRVKITVRTSTSIACGSNITNQASVLAKNYTQVLSQVVNTRVDCVPDLNFAMSLDKQVRNVSRGSGFANSAFALPGDVLEYRVVAKNIGNAEIVNLRLSDVLDNSTVLADFRDLTGSLGFSGSLRSGGDVFISSLRAGAEVTLLYKYTVASNAVRNFAVCNTISLTAVGISRLEDRVCVRGEDGVFVNLKLSKRAFNDTQNVNAVTRPAKGEDFITYFLRVENTGNSTATNFVINDDLSGVLPLADLVDLGGGSLSGQVLSFPAVNIPAGGFVEKTFRVRVKAFLPNFSYVMRNFYGNYVDIPINPKPPVVPPKTGSHTTPLTAMGLGGILTLGFAIVRRKFGI